MKNLKLVYIFAILIAAGIFNSCGNFLTAHKNTAGGIEQIATLQNKPSAYGTYLAARVAHLRGDFDTAADYYIKSIDLGAGKQDITGRAYLLLTSEGRIHEAAQFARKSMESGDKSNIIHFITMTDEIKDQQYDKALKSIQSIKDKVYQKSVLPLFEAWLYIAQNEPEKALKKLGMLKNDPSLQTLYYIHYGMINDFLDRSTEAQSAFDKVIFDDSIELSFRSLQIISNFYMRNGEKDKALALIEDYCERNNGTDMLFQLYQSLQDTDPQKLPRLIDSVQKGEAEALFNIGTVFRNVQLDISQLFTALALYLNEDHDVARVSSADLLEFNHRFKESISQYEKVSPSSPVYLMAQLKVASLYVLLGQVSEGLEKLKKLEVLYPNNYQVLFHLGEAYRMLNRSNQAIKYYEKALALDDQKQSENWTIYYALGMAYERNHQWSKAEKALLTAVDKSNRHPIVLNYLGYSWLKYNQNLNEALYMIFDAYRQNPEDGHIIDSLGWALYRMGKYEEAAKVLERASEYLPGNAIVYDHLGDAYWQNGRLDEARFQWQHALSLQEDAEELNKDIIRRKIKNGVQLPATLNFNETLLVERLKGLDLPL